MSRARDLAAAALAIAACSRAPAPAPAADGAPAADSGLVETRGPEDAAVEARASVLSPSPAGARDEAHDDDDAYLEGTPVRGRAIGHTSVAFKIELSNGHKGVFKPSSRRGPLRYKGEIAAYRLARALGLSNVPRAFFRALPARDLGAALVGTPAGDLLVREVLRDGENVKGALMPWIDKLDFLPLESDTKWRASLRKGQPVSDPELARQVSTMVVFDWLTANWDRWSGGNIGFDKATGTVLYVDNDGAFFERPPKDALKRSWEMVTAIDRFSRTFIGAVRALDDAAFARAIGEESPGAPLLSDKVLAAAALRRAELLHAVDAKIGDGGDTETLYFR